MSAEPTIIIGCPVYKRDWVLPFWIDKIEKQNYPKDKIGFIFLVAEDDQETINMLVKWGLSCEEYRSFDLICDNEEDHEDHAEGIRKWHPNRYYTMVRIRNKILDKLIAMDKPYDFYFSLDSDILLDDPDTLNKLVDKAHNEFTDGVLSPLCYMSNKSLRFPNMMRWINKPGDKAVRPPMYLKKMGTDFEVDIVMAAVFMPKFVYTQARYQYHINGEDLGFATDLFSKNIKSYSIGTVKCNHIMHRKTLEKYLNGIRTLTITSQLAKESFSMSLQIVESQLLKLPHLDPMIVEAVADRVDSKKARLVVEIDAIHEGLTKNYRFYTGKVLEGATPSWTDPFPRPILVNHDLKTEPRGRIAAARFTEANAGKKAGIILQAVVSDPDAVNKVLDGRYLTGSVGATAHEAFCSICNRALGTTGPCKHERGRVYEGKLAYWNIAEGMVFHEYSFVNAPGDTESVITKISMGENIEPQAFLVDEEFDAVSYISEADQNIERQIEKINGVKPKEYLFLSDIVSKNDKNVTNTQETLTIPEEKSPSFDAPEHTTSEFNMTEEQLRVLVESILKDSTKDLANEADESDEEVIEEEASETETSNEEEENTTAEAAEETAEGAENDDELVGTEAEEAEENVSDPVEESSDEPSDSPDDDEADDSAGVESSRDEEEVEESDTSVAEEEESVNDSEADGQETEESVETEEEEEEEVVEEAEEIDQEAVVLKLVQEFLERKDLVSKIAEAKVTLKLADSVEDVESKLEGRSTESLRETLSDLNELVSSFDIEDTPSKGENSKPRLNRKTVVSELEEQTVTDDVVEVEEKKAEPEDKYVDMIYEYLTVQSPYKQRESN